MGVLRISLFGTVRIAHDDWSSEVKIMPKAQALLAYLLLQGARLHKRERLVGLFWGDYSQERARNCLSTALWRLRCALEPKEIVPGTYLVTTPTGEVGFNWESDHWLDVTAFEGQVAPVLARPPHATSTADIQTLERALRLYTGDLLEGFYDDWAVREQERLRSLYLDCLEHLMRVYQHRGLYEESLAYGRQILEYEPLHEAIHREMMRIYLDSGQRALALRQYQNCCEVLSRELRVDPMEETRALYAQAVGDIGPGKEQVPIQVRRSSLHRALKQLGLAMEGFDEAHNQFKLASQRFEQAQRQLQQALQFIEHLIAP
jgi:DNA-binding SARP family transcriptional activator